LVEDVADEKAPAKDPERGEAAERYRKPPNFCQTAGTSSCPSSKPPFRIDPEGVGNSVGVAVGPGVRLGAGVGEGAGTVGVGVLVGEGGGPWRLRSSTQADTGPKAESSTRRRAEWAPAGAVCESVVRNVYAVASIWRDAGGMSECAPVPSALS
jgi:hypothetical protein